MIRLALRLAARELRAGTRGFRIVLVCLCLGVAAVAAVGSLQAAIERGLAASSRALMGGDLVVDTGAEPPPDALRTWLASHGAQLLSELIEFRAMLRTANGQSALVELNAVDQAWPLIGQAKFSPPARVASALARRERWGIEADPALLSELRLAPGAIVRLGGEKFTLRGAIVAQPDVLATPALFGPRVIIATAALPATGLIVPGALVEYHLRALLAARTHPATVARALKAAFGGRGWQVRWGRQANRETGEAIARAETFMTLVGLAALFVGAVGTANGVEAWLAARAPTIATLRCLGASARLVFATSLIEVLVLSAVGIVAGVVFGAAATLVLPTLLAGALPVPATPGLYGWPLARAAAFGFLASALFALPPLGRSARLSGAALFRGATPAAGERLEKGVIAAMALLGFALLGLSFASVSEPRLAVGFAAATGGTLALLRLAAASVIAFSRVLPKPKALAPRLALAAFHRPGNRTDLTMVSVGVALTLLAALAGIEGNVRDEIMRRLPRNAPSFYFIDIQSADLARFLALVEAVPGVRNVRWMPLLRARIVAVNGVKADKLHVAEGTRWALRGDRGLTYAAAPPPGTTLTAGRWWPAGYSGPPLVSLDGSLARGWGIGVGSSVTVSVLGRRVTFKVANLRRVRWESLQLNFVMIANPGLISAAPHEVIATLIAPPSADGRLVQAVSDALPGVSAISVGAVLRAVSALLAKVAAAVGSIALVGLIAGALVLAGAVLASRAERVREAVILKVLGASRGQIRLAWLIEFCLLGVFAGVLAAAIGAVASWAVVRFVFSTSWVFKPGPEAVVVALALVSALVIGHGGTETALRAPAAPILRSE